MTWSEYGRNASSFRWPYLFRSELGDGELLYFGSRHSYAPEDPQLSRIEELWGRFEPTLAFNEGGHPPVEPSRAEAIRRHGEAGLVRFLAARDNVPVTTLDPSQAQEVAWLERSYSPEQIKMFFVLRAVSQFAVREGTEGLESEIERILRIYHNTPGLRQPPGSWDEVGSLYEKHFPGRGPVSEVPSSWFDPARDDTVLNEIARASGDYRDRWMVQLLAGHVGEGHRVFAVVGGSHVVRQADRLRWALSR